MKNLIFVGGLQYSGKSSFCKRLEENDAKKYKHLELDSAYDHLVFHKDAFLNLIEKHFPDVHTFIKELGEAHNVSGVDRIDLFVGYMKKQNQFKELSNFLGRCSVLYSGECIAKTEHEIALLDGSFVNTGSRVVVYSLLRDAMNKDKENKMDLDSVNKLFVYFNLGLKLSLERFRANPSKTKESMILSEEKIKQTYEAQELPTHSEFPNLEVLVLENPDAVEAAVEHVLLRDFIRN
jgi:hypothetical protein